MDFDALEATLKERAHGRVQRDVSLARLTTYRLGGAAELYFEPAREGDLEVLSSALANAGPAPVLLLGRGSNVVVSDRGWHGLVVRPAPGSFAYLRRAPDVPNGLVAGAAASLPLLANWTARRSLTGLEFCISIPGSVGGGVRMNAGAHGGDIASGLARARVWDIGTGTLIERGASSFDFSYRFSNLGDCEMVVDATFELTDDDEVTIRERMERFRRHRAQTQPPAVLNAGSTFKNPPGDHAGRLVEAAGLKGFRSGGVAVSELHANFFVASEDATAQDVYDLVRSVKKRVHESLGVELEPEVRFVGEFRDGGRGD